MEGVDWVVGASFFSSVDCFPLHVIWLLASRKGNVADIVGYLGGWSGLRVSC